MPLPQQDIIQNLPVTQNLSYSVNRRFPQGTTSLVPIFQTVTAVVIPAPNRNTVTQGITVAPTIVISKEKSLSVAVAVAQTIGSNIDRVKSITTNVTILQILTAYLDKGVSGNSGGVFVDPAVAAFEAGLVAPGQVQFICNNPSALPNAINTTITIRKPEFGDSDQVDQFRVERLTFGGALDIMQDKMWPTTEKLEMSWEYLSETDATNLLLFLNTTLGQIITFKDQFGRTLTGYILTPFEDILQPKTNGWSAKFSYQIWETPNSANP